MTLKFLPTRVEANIIRTKSLFQLKRFAAGRESLRRTLELNDLSDSMGLELVEWCVDSLDFSTAHSEAEHAKMISIVKEAYVKLQARFPTRELIVVSELRTMTKHKLLQLGIEHLDRGRSMES